MSWRDIPVCPGDVIICRRSRADPGTGLFAAHFLPQDVTFSINRWYQVPPCGGNWSMYTSRSSGQMHSEPDRGHFLLITWYCFTLRKEWISPNSFLCIHNKNCRQANGDNRHIVPGVPTGLDRDIRAMPIACARTHPDANKHDRHIPMYRPALSAHANKCSQSHMWVGHAWHDVQGVVLEYFTICFGFTLMISFVLIRCRCVSACLTYSDVWLQIAGTIYSTGHRQALFQERYPLN